MPRFTDALDREASDIKRPKPLPSGYYLFRNTKIPEMSSTSSGEYDIIRIAAQVVEPTDVDEDALADFGKVQGQAGRLSFMFPTDDDRANDFEGALNRFKEFCTKCGIDTSTGTLKQWMADLPNTQFIAEVTHRTDKNDPSIVYAEINGGRISAVE